MLDTWESRILSTKILEKAVRFTTVIDMMMRVLKKPPESETEKRCRSPGAPSRVAV